MTGTRNVAICRQVAPQGRGYACDDHIEKFCYSVQIATAQEGRQLDRLLARVDELAEQAQDRRTASWFEGHPGETECLGEGEEFVNAVWVEHTPLRPGITYGDTPVSTMLRQLRMLRRELQEWLDQ